MARLLVGNATDLHSIECYDPSAGTGTLLMALAHKIGEDKCTIFAQDISQRSNKMLKLNLILNSLVSSLDHAIQGDTLIAPYHKSDNGQELRTFDYVVSNPPFKMDFSDTRERIAAMPVRFWAGVPKVPAKKKESMASALAGEKEELFLHYCSAVCENTDNSKKEFLEYLISFPYEKLDRNDYNLYIAFAKLMLENKDYGEFPLTYEAYSCKNTVNFVNMTALGEMLLSLKHLHGVDMSKTEIYHDNLMGYEEEYNQSFEDNKIYINFVDSKENELVQLADNISSIYRKCFEKSFEAFRCNKQWTDNIWFTENYSRIINTIGMEHIKMDTQISDYVLPFVIRDIFGNEYGQFEQNKEKFWGLFYFYKERIMEDIDAMKVDLPL